MSRHCSPHTRRETWLPSLKLPPVTSPRVRRDTRERAAHRLARSKVVARVPPRGRPSSSPPFPSWMSAFTGAKIFKTKCAQCHVAEAGGGEEREIAGSGREDEDPRVEPLDGSFQASHVRRDDREHEQRVEEALHRLVEINYKLGLIEESQKYAKILGYNYQSSDWYKKSYKVFNKDYSNQIPKKIKKDKKGVLEKFKKLFE